LKQSLPRLQVREEWLSDVERIEREAECQKFLGSLLGEDVVPRVVLQDPENHIFVMRRAPRDRQNWKDLLLASHTDLRLARRAGELLGTIHDATAGDAACKRVFSGKRYFEQLRLDPYYHRVAQVHPRLKDRILALALQLLHANVCLVHGDYSPKNMLVSDGQITLLDFEVGHYGDPAFDLGFFYTHLFLKALKHRVQPREYLELIRAFWNCYVTSLTKLESTVLESMFLPHLGVILLARVDGKSKLPYLDPREQDWVRGFAPPLVFGDFTSFDKLLEYLQKEVSCLCPK
jgi:aminoglycoside phosphotransferase (APT) family kinase protein